LIVLITANELGQQLQRMERLAAMGTLSAGIAHELKNALVAVSTFVEDLLLRHKDAELAGLAGRELHRIDRIVNQFLNLAAPAKPTLKPVRVHEIIERCLRLVQPQLKAKQIHLVVSLEAGPNTVEADENQLEQAFLNLLLNASEALHPKGNLTISTEQAARPSDFAPAPASSAPVEFLQISIADTGIGIAPQHLDEIFEPFFSTHPNGTGLGLAITRQIVREHKGEIRVASQLGKGTSFRIWLPLTGLN
jgi:signal transduction histidine kinase